MALPKLASRFAPLLALVVVACGSEAASSNGRDGGAPADAASSSADATSNPDGTSGGGGDDGTLTSPGDAAEAAAEEAGSAAGDGGCSPGPGGGGQPAIAALPNLANQYAGTFSSPPTLTDTNETPDGPLLGNGDVGVVVLGTVDATKFILGKNEFWSLAGGAVKAMATESVSIPGMKGASYAMTESIGTGQVTGKFTLNGNTINTTSWVQATDTTNNLFFTQYAYTGGGAQNVTVSLGVGNMNTNSSDQGSMGDVIYEDVAADNVDSLKGYTTRKVRVATGVIGTTGTVSNNSLSFTLTSGQTVTLASSIMSNVDASSYQTQSVSNVSVLTAASVTTYDSTHQAWWDSFYRMSYISIPDKTVEKEYYASLYLLASASRAGEAPPGLWGNWVMADPAWNSDYTLNYNFEAPFYATFPTNHLEQSANYDAPVVAWLPNAEAEAKSDGWTGAYYRVHIGPLPNGSGDNSTHNQKFCGAFAVTDMIMHYYFAPDPAYASSIYPTLKELVTFWQNYLVLEAGVYNIINDAQQEDDPDPQTDGVMSLGLVRFLFQGTIDISTALGMDESSRSVWQNILTNLAPFPTYSGCPTCTNGETVFRYTSVGRDWDTGNAIGIQHIYPGSQIGLSSDSSLLQIANNMIGAMARWSDGNGTNTFYPAAARVGYKPPTILSQLDSWIQNNTYPNLHIHTGGGGLENLNTVPSTVAEMLLQSFQGTIRVFPDWPSASNAQFANLRAYGGFLVASQMSGGAVPYVAITSEMGNSFTLANPWGQGQVAVYLNAKSAPAMSGSTLSLQTCPGEIVILAPSGTSYASIVNLMNAQSQ